MSTEIEEFNVENSPEELFQELRLLRKPIKSMYIGMVFEDDSTKSHIVYDKEVHLVALLGALRSFIDFVYQKKCN